MSARETCHHRPRRHRKFATALHIDMHLAAFVALLAQTQRRFVDKPIQHRARALFMPQIRMQDFRMPDLPRYDRRTHRLDPMQRLPKTLALDPSPNLAQHLRSGLPQRLNRADATVLQALMHLTADAAQIPQLQLKKRRPWLRGIQPHQAIRLLHIARRFRQKHRRRQPDRTGQGPAKILCQAPFHLLRDLPHLLLFRIFSGENTIQLIHRADLFHRDLLLQQSHQATMIVHVFHRIAQHKHNARTARPRLRYRRPSLHPKTFCLHTRGDATRRLRHRRNHPHCLAPQQRIRMLLHRSKEAIKIHKHHRPLHAEILLI